MSDVRWDAFCRKRDAVSRETERLRSIHHNPDAQAWAKFFGEKYKVVHLDGSEVDDSEDLMIGWFANAMMAMYDHTEGKRISKEYETGFGLSV